MDFIRIKDEYRPLPFWSWNEKLDINETKRQIYEMHKAGIGGFFMHARGGLQTEYMSDEWFANVEAAIETAEECGMSAWAYDENGWPSGFGNGYVNGKGIEFQQKYLRISDTKPEENLICKSGEHWFYYEVNPFYADTLNPDAVAEFIKSSYEPYYKRFGNRIVGFFTDEPQISRNGIPWSFVFEGEYHKRYKENLLEHLEELFCDINDYKKTRIKFWKMVTELFSNNFMKQIYDWCEQRGYKLTGHLAEEESLMSQLCVNGACMPHYEYFHIPGVDWLGRKIFNCLTPIQLGSAASQLDKPKVLTESFALCGHNVRFSELKGIFEWQLAYGVNMLCQHLEGYSLRGIRKRDYPPAMFYQQPWWKEYEKFNNAMTREGMIVGGAIKQVDVLVLHPQTTAWALFNDNDNSGIKELDEKLLSLIDKLERKHVNYHLGDEIIMERHAKNEDGKIVIGTQKYSYVITDCCEEIFDSTKVLLDAFVKSGGEIITVEELPYNGIIDKEEITYTKGLVDNRCLHYFINTSDREVNARISLHGKIVDIYSGEMTDFSGFHLFKPWDSLILIEDQDVEYKQNKSEIPIVLNEKFKICSPIQNSITLDYCDYYFDGELQEKNGYVLNICERANALERPVKIHQDYYVNIEYIPEKLFLVSETPEKFEITVNGMMIEKNIEGYFIDSSFKKINISKYLKIGTNTISFECDFVQSKFFYENLRKAYQFESEKNKLSYDMEIESIYLVGEFSVRTTDNWIELENNAVRYNGDFVIDKPLKEMELRHIERQGFPFWCGEIAAETEFDVIGDNSVISFVLKGINSVVVEINGIEKTYLSDGIIKLQDFNAHGKTKMKITMLNNLRNLLGPHHLNLGESIHTTPADFYKERCVWNTTPEGKWNDGYCLAEMSIFN